MSGKLKDLEELDRPIQRKKEIKRKRKIIDYRPVTITCDVYKGEVFVIKYPEENEFKKLKKLLISNLVDQWVL